MWCFPTKLLQLQLLKKCWHKHFSWTLHSSNSVRMHRIIIVILQFLISIWWTTGWCKLTFNCAPLILPNLYHMVWHALSSVVLILKGIYFLKVRGLGMSNMSFLIADVIVCIWYNDKFLKKGAAKFKSEKVLRVWLPDCNLKFSQNFENLKESFQNFEFRAQVPSYHFLHYS